MVYLWIVQKATVVWRIPLGTCSLHYLSFWTTAPAGPMTYGTTQFFCFLYFISSISPPLSFLALQKAPMRVFMLHRQLHTQVPTCLCNMKIPLGRLWSFRQVFKSLIQAPSCFRQALGGFKQALRGFTWNLRSQAIKGLKQILKGKLRICLVWIHRTLAPPGLCPTNGKQQLLIGHWVPLTT